MSKHGFAVALVLALGVLVAAPSPAGTDSLDPRLEAAIALYREAGAERALPEFERLAGEFARGPRRRDHAAALHYIGESHWRLAEFDQAREYLDRALTVERGAGDRLGEGKTLNVLGLLEWDLGNYEQALQKFRQAGDIARALGDRKLEGATLNNVGLVQDELGEYDGSLKTYRQALDLYRDADFPRGVGDTLGNIGGVNLLLGRFREALGYYEQALAISERLESTTSMSQDHGNIGLCLLGLGEIDGALRHFDQALGLAQQAGMQQDQAYWTRQKGNALIQKGQYDLGLGAHRAALAIYEEIGAQAELLEALHDMGRLHLLLGDAESAERDFSRALNIARSIEFSRGVTLNVLALGDLEFRRRRLAAAAELYEQARQRSSESGERHVAADSLLRLALVHREQKQLALAAQEASQALAIAREISARSIEAEALFAGAELERRRGRVDAALAGYDAAQAAQARIGDPDLLWQIHFGRGLAREAKGDASGAIDALLESVTLIESVRNRLQEPRFRSGYVEDKYEVYLELVRLQLQQGRTADAFSTAERLRARNYAEQLGGRASSPLSAEDRRTEAVLRGRIRQLQRAISDEENVEWPTQRQRAVNRLLQELLLAEQEYQAFLDDRGGARSTAAALGQIPAVSAIQRRLGSDEALLEYLVGSESLTVFVITPSVVSAITRPLGRGDINARVALLRDLIRRPGDDGWNKPAARLSAELIEPLERGAWLDGIDRLYVVPHGALNHLPFALLTTSARDGPGLLIDRYTLVYLPTAAALLSESSMPTGPQSLLAVAPARSRLRHAPDEARSVHALYLPNSRLLLGAKATESRFKKLAGRYRVLHLATHGDFNSVNPLLSGLELEADGIDDGLLQIHEILGLELDADLVTLSACETALGSGYFAAAPAGDELVGMTRAFLAAGSASVMATLWEVDDAASVSLMKRFYQRLNESGDVRTAAAALARTQRDLRATKELGHPYFWAPFVLAGTTNRTAGQAQLSHGRTP